MTLQAVESFQQHYGPIILVITRTSWTAIAIWSVRPAKSYIERLWFRKMMSLKIERTKTR